MAPAPRDRGRTIALGVLGALLLIGGVLILRGPQGPSPAAALTSAELPGAAASGAAAAAPTAAIAIAAVDAGPKAPPAWRISALEKEVGVEIVRGPFGKHSLAGALAQAGITNNEIRRVTLAVSGIHRIEHAGPKDTFVVARDRSHGTINAFEVIASKADVWQARADEGGALVVKKLELPIERKTSRTAVVITADLKQAIGAAGLREEAIEEIDDALEGRGDAAVIKSGVRLRVVGNEEWVDGTFAGFRVDAVEYVPRSGAPLRVYYYEREAATEGSRRRMPHPGYYDAKGQQPFRGVFRSPLALARVTSRFNPKRMHPVLHVVTPHNGIDFGATTGTPVFAASAGTVRTAGNGGPCGNMVELEHTAGITTAYCHLSKFAAGLHPGQHVEARQLVGYVGATGRVTGPHLHFAVKRAGAFIDPLGLKMDGVHTLPPADRDAFAKRRAELDVALEAITLPAIDGSVAVDDKDDKDDPTEE